MDRGVKPIGTLLPRQYSAAAEPLAPTEYARPDALTLYLREAGRVPLLTREEETALARRVRAGDAKAREHMILANLRLVVKIAREYENLGLPLLDLINEGNIGLMKAVERFDPDKGSKLSSYGSLWIRQQIRRALGNQGRTIRVPSKAVDQLCDLRKAEVKHQETCGHEASNAELAEALGLSVRRVARLRGAGQRPASLDAPQGETDSRSLAETIADDNAVNPAEHTDENDAIRRLPDLLARIPDRESKILRARFGLDDGRERTLEAVGARLGVTRERIRQLQAFALIKLRQMIEQPGVVEQAG